MKRSFEYYLNEFLKGISWQEGVDYGNPLSVRKYNRGTDTYRKAAKNIYQNHPERIDDFAVLLDSDNNNIRLCCAVCLVEICHCSGPLYKKCISIVKEELNGWQELGWKMWLNKWEKTGE